MNYPASSRRAGHRHLRTFGLVVISIFSAASLICPPPARAAAASPTSPASIYPLIDAALENRRRLPCYRTLAIKEHGRGTEKITRYVRNTGAVAQLWREERTVELPRLPARRTVFVQNEDGLWQEHEGAVLRLMFPSRLERPIPNRMAVARVLCLQNGVPYDESKHLICTTEDTEYFGRPCTKIVLSLAPEIAAFARDYDPNGSAGGDENAGHAKRPSSPPPSSFVYYINKSPEFVLCWQAFGVTGNKLAEASFQEFEVNDTLPENLFTTPQSAKVIVVSDHREHTLAMEQLRPPPPATK